MCAVAVRDVSRSHCSSKLHDYGCMYIGVDVDNVFMVPASGSYTCGSPKRCQGRLNTRGTALRALWRVNI